MTKRLLALFLAIILICSVAGCASSKDDVNSGNETIGTENQENVTPPEEDNKAEGDNKTTTPTEQETTETPERTETTTPSEETTQPTTDATQSTTESTDNPNTETENTNTTNTTSENKNNNSSTDRVVVTIEGNQQDNSNNKNSNTGSTTTHKDPNSNNSGNTSSSKPVNTTGNTPVHTTNNTPAKQTYSNIGLTTFDSKMISYMEKTYGTSDNLFMSPLSLKYTLAMAAIGAKGETRQEILQVLGFKDIKECENWAKTYIKAMKTLDKLDTAAPQTPNYSAGNGNIISIGGGSNSFAPTILNIANSVWHNTNKQGTISSSFTNNLKEICDAKVFNVSGNNLKDEMNDWVNQETNGMIQDMFDDSVKNKDTIIINALYLKATWKSKFNSSLTHEDDFTCANGKTVKKTFMRNSRCNYKYYKDNETELVIITMEDGLEMLCVKGSTENIASKMSKAKPTLMDLYIPKFEMTSNLNNGELTDFLKANGVNKMFSNSADFSNMINSETKIEDIMQSTKIKVDENGLEASAVTSAIAAGSANGKIEEPIVVKFDEAFKFFIYNYNTNGTTPEVLFYGNYAK